MEGDSLSQPNNQCNDSLNLNLSLGPPSQSPPRPPPTPSLLQSLPLPPPPPPPSQPSPCLPSQSSPSPQPPTQVTSTQPQNQQADGTSNQQIQQRPRRRRRTTDTSEIEPPYPWATEQRAIVHQLEYLRSNGILKIKGEVKCKRCERKYEIEYDLMSKFDELTKYIEREKDSMHQRAPQCWINPNLLNCLLCLKEKCVEPVITSKGMSKGEDEDKERNVNWLFLLLGQLLGCLTLKELKYFLAQNREHRTGAKDRLVYLTYFGLCKQLQPLNPLFHGK